MGWWIVGGCILAFFIVWIISNRFVCANKKTMKIKDLPPAFEGYRILHISDLHASRYGKCNKSLIRKVNSCQFDCIFATGDLMDRFAVDGKPFFELLDGIDPHVPIYYCVGNHESRVQQEHPVVFARFMEKLRTRGVHILSNSSAVLTRRDHTLTLYGLDIPLAFYYKGENLDSLQGFFDAPPDHPALLLTHDPLWFPAYAKWGADGVFSGHIHGGGVRLPFVGGLLSPRRHFFPPYDAGLYTLEDAQMHLSRGLGSSFPIRMCSLPEITTIVLRRKRRDDND